MDSKTLFTKIPVLKLFFIASVPGAVSMLASALYQLIDGILVGQVLGDTPFAALNLAMPFVIINFSLADLVGVGSAVPISISLGRKEEREADNYFTCACLMIVSAGVLIGAVLFLLAVPLLKLMGAEGELLKLSVQYLRVYALCAPVTKNTGKYAFEHFYVSSDRSFGICLSLYFPVGNLGSRACYLQRHVHLHPDCFLSFFQRKNAASFLQAEIFQGDDQKNCKLRQPELSEQYCGKDYLDPYEFSFAAHGRRPGGVCIWNPHVRGRICTAFALWNVRFPPAGSRL